MAIRTIVKVGDDILNKKCRPVTDFNDRLFTLLEDMHETLTEAHGAGLAASGGHPAPSGTGHGGG